MCDFGIQRKKSVDNYNFFFSWKFTLSQDDYPLFEYALLLKCFIAYQHKSQVTCGPLIKKKPNGGNDKEEEELFIVERITKENQVVDQVFVGGLVF